MNNSANKSAYKRATHWKPKLMQNAYNKLKRQLNQQAKLITHYHPYNQARTGPLYWPTRVSECAIHEVTVYFIMSDWPRCRAYIEFPCGGRGHYPWGPMRREAWLREDTREARGSSWGVRRYDPHEAWGGKPTSWAARREDNQWGVKNHATTRDIVNNYYCYYN